MYSAMTPTTKITAAVIGIHICFELADASRKRKSKQLLMSIVILYCELTWLRNFHAAET